jgi:hypothetical protein
MEDFFMELASKSYLCRLMKVLKYFIVILIFLSCKNKEFSSIDNPVEEDKIAGTRVVFNDIGGYTIEEDSLEGKGLSSVYLGSLYDPIFGRTDASFYMNFEIDGGQSNVSLGVNPMIDSMVLYLKYSTSIYLDTLQTLKITVNELNEKVSVQTKFNAKTKLDVLAKNLVERADSVFDIKKKRVVDIADTITGYLKIKLDTSTWTRIQGSLASTDVLQSSFKGIYITTETSIYDNKKGAMATLNVADSRSALVCFYHRKDSVQIKGKLLLTSKTASSLTFNRYSPIYTAGNLGVPGKSIDLSNSLDSTKVNKKLFLHGFGAYAAKLNLSGYTPDNNPSFLNNPTSRAAKYFDSIRNIGGQIAINRALILLKPDANYFSTDYKRPLSLFMTGFDTLGKEVLLQETLLDNSGNFLNGTFDDIKNAYVFNITQTMQKLVERKLKLKGFRISVGAGNRSPNRVVLDLDKNSANKPELEIYYTRLK